MKKTRLLSVLVLLVVILVVAALCLLLPSRTQRTDALPTGPTGTMNILIVGKDARALNPSEDRGTVRIRREQRSHADIIIICHINFDRPAVNLVAVPRDLLVEVPGITRAASAVDFTNMEKINHTYAIGGDRLLRRTLEQLLGITIHRSIAFDFDSFRIVYDLLRPFVGVLDVRGRQLADREAALKLARQRNNLPYDDVDRCRNAVTLVKQIICRTWWLANTRLGDGLLRRILAVLGPDTDLTGREINQIAGQLHRARFRPAAIREAVLVGYGADVTMNRYGMTLSCYLPVYREIEKQARVFLHDQADVDALDFMTQQNFPVPVYATANYVLPIVDSAALPSDTTGMDSALAKRWAEIEAQTHGNDSQP
ncbi:MAG: LCP family protein [candidate division WOR-3 bacterium]